MSFAYLRPLARFARALLMKAKLHSVKVPDQDGFTLGTQHQT